MPGTAIDSLLALMGRSRNPQLPPTGRLSDVDLTRIQGAALADGDRAKADRVSEVNALRADEAGPIDDVLLNAGPDRNQSKAGLLKRLQMANPFELTGQAQAEARQRGGF